MLAHLIIFFLLASSTALGGVAVYLMIRDEPRDRAEDQL